MEISLKKTKLKSNAIKRREDKRFLTGRGKYLDDIFFDEEYFAVFVRSPHPHAKIKEIRTSTAKVLPDVVAVLTAEDAAKDGLVSMEPFITHNPNTNQPFNFIAQPLLSENFGELPIAKSERLSKPSFQGGALLSSAAGRDTTPIVNARSPMTFR